MRISIAYLGDIPITDVDAIREYVRIIITVHFIWRRATPGAAREYVNPSGFRFAKSISPFRGDEDLHRVACTKLAQAFTFAPLQERLHLKADAHAKWHEQTKQNTAAFLLFDREKEKAPCLTLPRAVSHPLIFR